MYHSFFAILCVPPLLSLFIVGALLFYPPDLQLIRNFNSGSTNILVDVAGQECTEAFDDAGHSDEAHGILPDLEIGILSATDALSNDSVPQVVTNGTERTKEAVNGILKPNIFQEFELREKKEISHNVAM